MKEALKASKYLPTVALFYFMCAWECLFGLGLSFKKQEVLPFHLKLILPQTSTVTSQHYNNRILLVRIGTDYCFRFITTGEEKQNKTQHFCLKKSKSQFNVTQLYIYIVSTKKQHLANTAVLTSAPNIKYIVPLTKYPSTHGQAIVDVDKYLGHCCWSHTCLMIPLTEVPCGEIQKLIKKQQCHLKSSERSPTLVCRLCVGETPCFFMTRLPKFLLSPVLSLQFSKYMLMAFLDKQNKTKPCILAYRWAQAD